MSNSGSLDLSPVLQERRSVSRGQNLYYQKSYDLNRLRYELENSLRAPRHKPYFHQVNEVYSYYLPPKFTKINANVENFSDRFNDRMRSDQSFGTKTRSMTRMRGHERVELTRRVLPKHNYYAEAGRGFVGALDRNSPDSYDRPITGSQYQTGGQTGGDYRTPYQRISPDAIRRGVSSLPVVQPGDTVAAGLPIPRVSSIVRDPPLYSADTTGLIPEPQSLIRNSSFPGIPGYQRIDFPGYSTIPNTGFRCASQPYYGYYADVNAGCQV